MTRPRVDALELLTSRELIGQAQDGDGPAREELARRFRPLVRRFAERRLPARARGRLDTEDLVQDAFVHALEHLGSFAPARRGAFLAYLRQIVMNRLRDELRAAAVRRAGPEPGDQLQDPGPGPSSVVFGREILERYRDALASLSPEKEEAVVLRFEMECSFEEIATALGKRSANAARMTVVRAAEKLAEALGGRIVLMDFSAVAELPKPGAPPERESAVGTPMAMAPEQLLGEPLLAATDLYGLGACSTDSSLDAFRSRRRHWTCCACGTAAGRPCCSATAARTCRRTSSPSSSARSRGRRLTATRAPGRWSATSPRGSSRTRRRRGERTPAPTVRGTPNGCASTFHAR